MMYFDNFAEQLNHMSACVCAIVQNQKSRNWLLSVGFPHSLRLDFEVTVGEEVC